LLSPAVGLPPSLLIELVLYVVRHRAGIVQLDDL
jgi:hypothetical protein